MGEGDTRVEVALPADPARRALIDRLARYIAKDGQPLENMV